MRLKNLSEVTPQLPEYLGPQLSETSLCITFATDAALPITLDNTTGAGAVDADTLRVVIATDQSTLPVDIQNATLAVTQSGTWNITNVSGTVSLPTGAATAANQATANAALAAIETAVEGTLTVSGTVAATQSGAWSVTVDSSALPTGAATEATLAALAAEDFATQTTLAALNGKVANGAGTAAGAVRITVASDSPRQGPLTGRSKVELIRNDYTSTSVTTAAYVQLVASTSADINQLDVFDSSGQTLVLAIGAAAAEVDTYYIAPGGNGKIDLNIPSGSRLSVKAVSATADVGELAITALS